MIKIRVPCSSANIGPGFDVIGLALSIYLELHVTINTSTESSPSPLNCTITYEGKGTSEVDLNADRNLLTRTALYVLRCHGHPSFPSGTHVHIINPIPLGRGLGSSGAAVVAGVILGNEVCNLGLSKARILDYCLMIERHPDNVAAALYGGFVGTYLNELDPTEMARKEIPLSEVLPSPAGGINTGLTPPKPPLGIGHYIKFKWAPEIKAVAIIPDFEVPTAKARDALPKTYSIKDVVSQHHRYSASTQNTDRKDNANDKKVFNLQRLALLTAALGQSPPDPNLIYQAMQDKVHQPYRKTLIPGLAEILLSVTPETHPGLLGICLSGAGPTILALATDHFEVIAKVIVGKFGEKGIACEWKVLEPAEDGATVTRT
ncbi:MAG: Trihydroxynaphthalene reductase [Pleopsidium flavum]|nr:MAG: Trihydroxynaphthalene reductase [Pleopsidium flavum]